MILRRYGTTIQSVEVNFDSKAFTEIGFRRVHAFSASAEDFLAGHERVSGLLFRDFVDVPANGKVRVPLEVTIDQFFGDVLEKQ